MEIVFVSIIFIFIILLDYKPTWKDGNKKAILLYSVVLILSYVIIILRTKEFEIPSPTYLIENIIKSFINVK